MRRLLAKAAIGLLAGAASGLAVSLVFPQVAGAVPLATLTGAGAVAGLVGAVVEEILERLLRP